MSIFGAIAARGPCTYLASFSGLELTVFIETAINSRRHDVSLSLLDTRNRRARLQTVIQESLKWGNVFSRTFLLAPGSSPRTIATYNSLCRITDSHERESRPTAPRHIEKTQSSLELGVAENALERVITKPIDFSGAFLKGTPRLYCDDTQALDRVTHTAGTDFSLLADKKTLSLNFFPSALMVSNTILICQGSAFASLSRAAPVTAALEFMVHSNLSFAVDGIFPPPAQIGLVLPRIEEV